MKFILPLPPSKNAIHVRTKFGIALSHKARAWKKMAIAESLAQVEEKELAGFVKYTEAKWPLVVQVRCFFPDNRRRDIHNCFEILADALQEALGIDDSNFLMQAWVGWIDKGNPRVEVTIEKMK